MSDTEIEKVRDAIIAEARSHVPKSPKNNSPYRRLTELLAELDALGASVPVELEVNSPFRTSGREDCCQHLALERWRKHDASERERFVDALRTPLGSSLPKEYTTRRLAADVLDPSSDSMKPKHDGGLE